MFTIFKENKNLLKSFVISLVISVLYLLFMFLLFDAPGNIGMGGLFVLPTFTFFIITQVVVNTFAPFNIDKDLASSVKFKYRALIFLLIIVVGFGVSFILGPLRNLNESIMENAASSGNISKCSFLLSFSGYWKDECIKRFSVQNNEIFSCLKVNDYFGRSRCISDIAMNKKNNISVCNGLSKDYFTERFDCRFSFIRSALWSLQKISLVTVDSIQNACSFSENRVEQFYCLMEGARIYHYPSLCDAVDFNNREYIAFNSNNGQNQYHADFEKNSCYWEAIDNARNSDGSYNKELYTKYCPLLDQSNSLMMNQCGRVLNGN